MTGGLVHQTVILLFITIITSRFMSTFVMIIYFHLVTLGIYLWSLPMSNFLAPHFIVTILMIFTYLFLEIISYEHPLTPWLDILSMSCTNKAKMKPVDKGGPSGIA